VITVLSLRIPNPHNSTKLN